MLSCSWARDCQWFKAQLSPMEKLAVIQNKIYSAKHLEVWQTLCPSWCGRGQSYSVVCGRVQVSLRQSTNFCLFEQIRFLYMLDFAAIAFISVFCRSLSLPPSVAGFYMDEALLTSSILPQTFTFLHLSGPWSVGGGLLSSGVVMQHRDKHWSDSWICCFFFSRSLCSQWLCICRDRNGRTFHQTEEGWPQKDTGPSQQRMIKARRLLLLYRTGWPNFPACLGGESKRHAGQSQQVVHTRSGKLWKMRADIAKHTLMAIAACGVMFPGTCSSRWHNRKCALLLVCQQECSCLAFVWIFWLLISVSFIISQKFARYYTLTFCASLQFHVKVIGTFVHPQNLTPKAISSISMVFLVTLVNNETLHLILFRYISLVNLVTWSVLFPGNFMSRWSVGVWRSSAPPQDP